MTPVQRSMTGVTITTTSGHIGPWAEYRPRYSPGGQPDMISFPHQRWLTSGGMVNLIRAQNNGSEQGLGGRAFFPLFSIRSRYALNCSSILLSHNSLRKPLPIATASSRVSKMPSQTIGRRSSLFPIESSHLVSHCTNMFVRNFGINWQRQNLCSSAFCIWQRHFSDNGLIIRLQMNRDRVLNAYLNALIAQEVYEFISLL